MKYRKKPIVVDAEQWLGGYPIRGVYSDEGGKYCVTAQGKRVRLCPGDWIILETVQDTAGIVLAYPCKDSVFKETYEKVEG